MRTVGRKLRSGARSVALCDYCDTRWYREDLVRDEAGLLRCPQEGPGRDKVALSRANTEAAQEWAAKKAPEPHDVGRLDKETAEPVG